MIEINLLPDELKVKAKAKPKKEPVLAVAQPAGWKKPGPVQFAAIGLGVFVLVNLSLLILMLVKAGEVEKLNRKWISLEPQRKILEGFKNEFSLNSADALAAKQLLAQAGSWSRKLNKLSLCLPSGVWFNEASLANGVLVIQGSAVSLQQEELALVNRFLDSLKQDKDFFKDFTGLELSSVQKRTIGGYDISDFTIQAALKQK